MPRSHPGPSGAGHVPSPAGYGSAEHGAPQVRGGHPEPPESATGPHGVGGPPRLGPRTSGSGPRQEYLDAFDDDVFAAGASSGGRGGTDRPGREPADDVSGAAGRDASDGAGAPTEEATGPDAGPDGRRARAGTKGRTFTGVFAAAVTTVLAIVVAGQVTGLEQDGGDRAASAETGNAHGGEDPAGAVPSPSGDAVEDDAENALQPSTYGERIAEVIPLDPDLHGPGAFTPAGGAEKAPGGGDTFRYRVDVEDGLVLDGELFAEAVHRTLNDDRSWAHDGERAFERVASGEADFVITLASPGTTGLWCAKSGLDTTERNVSCDSAATDRVMINAWRWAQGSETFGEDRIRAYREMLINHEVGHRLGMGHRYCEADGAPAPVMMQQTKTLTSDGRTCRPNPWPHPKKDD